MGKSHKVLKNLEPSGPKTQKEIKMGDNKKRVMFRRGHVGIGGIVKPIKAVGELEKLSSIEEEKVSRVIKKHLPDDVLIWSTFNGPDKTYVYRDCETKIGIGNAVRCGKNTVVVEAYVVYTKETDIKYIYLVHNDKARMLCRTYAGMGDILCIEEVIKRHENILVGFRHDYNRRNWFISSLIKLSDL